MVSNLISRDSFLICIVEFLISLGFSAIDPIMPSYLLTFGVTYTIMGLIISALSFSRVFFNMMAGTLRDAIGSRKTILAGLLLRGLGIVFFALASDIFQLTLTRLIMGAGGALYAISSLIFVAYSAPKEQRATYLSYYHASLYAGEIIGPTFGGVMITIIGFKTALVLVGVFCFTSMIIVFTLLNNNKLEGKKKINISSEKPKFSGALLNLQFLAIGLILLAHHLVSSMRTTMIPLYGENWLNLSYTEVGLVISTVNITTLLFILPIGKLVDRWGRKIFVMIGFVLQSMSALLFSLSRNQSSMFFGSMLLGSGGGILETAMQLASIEYARPEDAGRVVGALRTIGDFGLFIGPPIFGFLIDIMGVSTPFYLISVVCIITAIIAYIIV